ncbi:hypothetical protein BC829DRAFT_380049 [Chytridium lagenaria]|nr:hypothetical protein BC829DRAFT_380049 [Chytridium lagenaria]
MFKKRTKSSAGTKRKKDEEDDTEDLDTSIVRKKKDDKTSLLSVSSSSASSKLKLLTDEPERTGHVAFAASGSAASLMQNMSTRTIDVDGTAEEAAEAKVYNGEEAEGLYKGMNGYKEYVNKKVEKTTQSNASKLRAGPLKGLTNVRISCRFDYQQDICKDYKETGFCGFGDSCVFMHDRGDYKTGWQLDQEWEEQQKQKAKEREKAVNDDGEENVEEDVEEDDDLPFACPICGGDFKDPNCAVKHHAKSSKCFICNVATGGVFNAARDLLSKIAQKKKRMEDRAAEIRKKAAENEEVEDA